MKQQSKSSDITIGLDLGDRRHRFCALDERGEVVEEGSICNAVRAMIAPSVQDLLELRGLRIPNRHPQPINEAMK